MNSLELFNDSSLQNIEFINFGKNLLIQFANSYNGETLGFLKCIGIIEFKYQDQFKEYIDDSLSDLDSGFLGCYIGCVCIENFSDFYQIKFEPIVDNITINCLAYEIIAI